MPKPGLRKTYKYSDEFKATAVQLSNLEDVLIQDVAEAPCQHQQGEGRGPLWTELFLQVVEPGMQGVGD